LTTGPVYETDKRRKEYAADAFERMFGFIESNTNDVALILVEGSLTDIIFVVLLKIVTFDETSKCKLGEKSFKLTYVRVMGVDDDASYMPFKYAF
jgi:hypothetical protein